METSQNTIILKVKEALVKDVGRAHREDGSLRYESYGS